ncbi:MAG TPA: sulfite exporter TauE/SafE family protein, partial [Paracoccaceae bacterium]|nr:sulfite exporter TauE/SafE family protein [Paracoccaceae bacterium]
MELTLANVAIASAGVILAGISKGGFGNGIGFASTPLIALALGPTAALALMLPLLMIMDAIALRAWWGRWDWQTGVVMILGAFGGIALGAAVYAMISPDFMRLMMGIVALVFVALMFSQRVLGLTLRRQAPGRAEGVFWGGVAGLTSFVSHAGGPPVAVYLLGRPLTKEQYQSTSVLFFAVVNFVKFFIYAYLGFFSARTFLAVAALAPVAILATS